MKTKKQEFIALMEDMLPDDVRNINFRIKFRGNSHSPIGLNPGIYPNGLVIREMTYSPIELQLGSQLAENGVEGEL